VTVTAAWAPAVTVTRTTTVSARPIDPLQVDPLPVVVYGTGPAHTRTFTTTSVSFEAIYADDCCLRRSSPRFVAHLDRKDNEVGLIAHTAGRSGRGVAGLDNGEFTFLIVVDTRAAGRSRSSTPASAASRSGVFCPPERENTPLHGQRPGCRRPTRSPRLQRRSGPTQRPTRRQRLHR